MGPTFVSHTTPKTCKAVCKQFEVHDSATKNFMHKWKTFKTAANLTRRGHSQKIPPRATSQNLQASVSMLTVKVHDSKSRERLYRYGLFERVTRRNSLFSTVSSEQTRRISETTSFGQTRPVEMEMFGDITQHHIYQKANMAYQHKRLIQAQHGDERVMIWSHRTWALFSH